MQKPIPGVFDFVVRSCCEQVSAEYACKSRAGFEKFDKGGDGSISRAEFEASTQETNGSDSFLESLESEFAVVRLAPAFSSVLTKFFALEADLAAIDQVLLHPPKTRGDRAIYSITRAKVRAETSVREAAQEIVKCEKRLAHVCEYFNVTKAHCGVDSLQTANHKITFNKKFVDPEQGRPLWETWVLRAHHGTLDELRPDHRGALSWYYVADFNSAPDGNGVEDGGIDASKYFVKSPNYQQRGQKRWYDAEADELIYFGQEVLDELLKMVDRAAVAAQARMSKAHDAVLNYVRNLVCFVGAGRAMHEASECARKRRLD